MPAYETLQSIAQARYKQDVPGALKKALENTTPGSTSSITGINGLAVLAYNSIADPDIASGEWHGRTNPDVYAAVEFVLQFSAAP